ncbi:transcriptional repressor LexA [Kamptonema cortianum]|nr:transcriptional repressor LexA [Oscillatoria laete-virens]MDK3159587.1 transcriptional repressor LexA [Kamptonema cortianum]MDL5048634.1 transcriptional repressor LexA [Oscillatoria amoena NRMC-F 0135]MDL5053275.1 transcriptional repressor LexA [Oscillatoria laete-virens NRMC-F 0139]
MMTKRQQEIYDYIQTYQMEHGFAPSQRDIQRHFGFASQTTVADHLRLMEKKGCIDRQSGCARAITLATEIIRDVADRGIPLFGTIPAGMPIENHQDHEGYLRLDLLGFKLPINHRCYGLRVRGDSMIDAHVCDGDIVIMEVRQARPNDIVAALIDGETTLKRLVIVRGQPCLKAENPRYKNLIPVGELVIQGVMIGLVRWPGLISQKP